MSLAQKHIKLFNSTMFQQILLALVMSTLALPPAKSQAVLSTTTSCPLEIRAKHQTKSCLQKDLSEIVFPTVDAPCSAVTSLTYEDSYYELANTGLTAGYFDLSRWQKKSGDGGVDVTGAPNCVLVEGANIAQVTVAPGHTAILEIVVPTKGFAAFDWKNIGGSNLLFSTKRNAETHIIQNPGFYRSSFLQVGDIFTIQMENTSKNQAKVQISDFQFFTKEIAVIERRWTVKDDQQQIKTTAQFIAIEPLPLANIIFPENLNGKTAPILRAETTNAPLMTGWPVFDEDGEAITLYDQHELDGLSCAFSYSWKDELTLDQQGYIILRHWSVEDRSGNTRQHDQIIRIDDISNIQDKNLVPVEQPSADVGKKTSAIKIGDDYNSATTTL